MEVSNALKQFRVAYSLTQKQTALIAGVNERAYQRYESRERTPTLEVLLNLANYFDVSIDYIVGRTSNSQSHKL